MITLPEKSNLPLYQTLYLQLRSEIQQGRFPCGKKLPSKRKLSEQLGISVNTVDAAYGQLEAEGFIQSSPRRGYFVLETGLLPVGDQTSAVATASPVPSAETYQADFSPQGMAREQFPFGIWRRLMRGCFNEYDPLLLLRTPPQGDPGLRRAVSEYLYRARGVRCQPDQIVIGAGTDNLLLMLGYILPPSFTLTVENPLYNHAHGLFSRLGHRVTAVDVTPEGIRLDQLPETDCTVVYTTPSHQYPLGFSTPIGQRTALLRWSSAGNDRYIIEDDYDSEFRYGSHPIPSLQSIDRLGRVIYLGTFSRSVAPALRISYMVLPPKLLEQFQTEYHGFSSTVSGFEQAVLREFMTKGHFESHVNRMRIYYRARRKCLVEALSPLQPYMELLGQAAGHHLTIRMHNGMTESELLKTAEQVGVRIYPVSPYFLGDVPQEYRATVLLGFGGLGDEEIRRGAALLVDAWLPKSGGTR